MKLKVFDNLHFQEFPIEDDFEEWDITNEELYEVGITKQFDLQNHKVIDYVNLDLLRERRENECFPIINRGELWYDTLTDKQIVELKEWYQAWLDVTETKIIPQKPEWLK